MRAFRPASQATASHVKGASALQRGLDVRGDKVPVANDGDEDRAEAKQGRQQHQANGMPVRSRAGRSNCCHGPPSLPWGQSGRPGPRPTPERSPGAATLRASQYTPNPQLCNGPFTPRITRVAVGHAATVPPQHRLPSARLTRRSLPARRPDDPVAGRRARRPRSAPNGNPARAGHRELSRVRRAVASQSSAVSPSIPTSVARPPGNADPPQPHEGSRDLVVMRHASRAG